MDLMRNTKADLIKMLEAEQKSNGRLFLRVRTQEKKLEETESQLKGARANFSRMNDQRNDAIKALDKQYGKFARYRERGFFARLFNSDV